MGIDWPNIRHVVHWEVPRTLVEAYFQEIGHAGRDGPPAVATLLYHTRHMNDKFCSSPVQANTNNNCLRMKIMDYVKSAVPYFVAFQTF